MSRLLTLVTGSGNNVSEAVDLQTSLYVVEYEFVCEGKWASLDITLESFDNPENNGNVYVSALGARKGATKSGKQTIRAKEGRHVISIDATETIEWTVKLLEP